MSGLQQLNLRFDPLEDRLLFTLNTADEDRFVLWLTRRVTKLLLTLLRAAVEHGAERVLKESAPPTAAETAASPAAPSVAPSADDAPADGGEASAPPTGSREAVAAFQRDNALAKVDFSTEFQQPPARFPLGETPVLASRIDYRHAEDGTLNLTFVVGDNQGINLGLDGDLQHAVIKLLEEAAEKAEWDLNAVAAAAPTPVAFHAGDGVVH